MKGRKRHSVVDALGLVLGCYVPPANTADVRAAPAVLVWVLELFQRIIKVLADQGYGGDLGALIGHFFATQERSVEVEISQRPTHTQGFQVEQKRGRLFAFIHRFFEAVVFDRVSQGFERGLFGRQSFRHSSIGITTAMGCPSLGSAVDLLLVAVGSMHCIAPTRVTHTFEALLMNRECLRLSCAIAYTKIMRLLSDGAMILTSTLSH